jgi:hypothetical protein
MSYSQSNRSPAEFRLTRAQWNAVTRPRRCRQSTLAVVLGLLIALAAVYLAQPGVGQ